MSWKTWLNFVVVHEKNTALFPPPWRASSSTRAVNCWTKTSKFLRHDSSLFTTDSRWSHLSCKPWGCTVSVLLCLKESSFKVLMLLRTDVPVVWSRSQFCWKLSSSVADSFTRKDVLGETPAWISPEAYFGVDLSYRGVLLLHAWSKRRWLTLDATSSSKTAVSPCSCNARDVT